MPGRVFRTALLAAALALFYLPTHAQVLLRGTVTDARTGEALPSANIQIEGTYRGTITNADGRYELRVEETPAVVLFRYIGYETARLPVTGETPATQDVALTPVAYALGELVVTGEDPAVDIMRRVIERKRVWREALETFRAEAYNRFTMENDTGIVSILESLTETYWDRERGFREVVRAKRQTSNLSFDEYLPAARFVLNLYDDDVEVAGHRFVGVTHPDALRHYRFTLEGVRSLDDRAVYDIRVEPKSSLQTAFAGRVAVLDDAYALLEAELRPNEAFLFPPPINAFDVTYAQQFSDFDGDFWLPVDFRASYDLKVAFRRLLVFPTFRIRQVSRLTNYAVNVPLPDSLYRGDDRDEVAAVDTAAVRSDTLLDRVGTAVPLSAREATAYATVDSTMTLEKAYAPTGTLARFARVEEGGDDRDEGRGGGRLGRALSLDVEPRLWYNRVEGLHAGATLGRSFGRLTAHGTAGYATASDAAEPWSYGGGLRLRWGPRGRGHVAAAYLAETATRYDSDRYGRAVAGLYQLFGGADYFDYFRREGWTAEAGYRFRNPRAAVTLVYRDEDHAALPAATSYDLVGRDRPQRPNPVAQPGRLRSVGFRLQLGDTGETLGLSGQNQLTLAAEHAGPDLLGGDFSFTRLSAQADVHLTTFFRRRLLPNTLDVRLAGATYAGTLPPQRFGIIETSLAPYTPFGTLRAAPGAPFVGRQHAAVFWEHNFRTIPFELLGLRKLARLNHTILLHGAHGRTWGEGGDAGTGGTYHELGLSIGGLLDFFRLDLTKRLDAPGFSVGAGVTRLF